MTYAVLVEVWLRPGIADPQGATIERALPALGFENVGSVRTGKCVRLEVEAPDEATAVATVEDLCARFLANPVMEDTVVRVLHEVPR
ncbi:MAG TPA: phosphoribosylformylglycinamidine synthase subunit PurS [Acidimicrobiales bacterium]